MYKVFVQWRTKVFSEEKSTEERNEGFTVKTTNWPVCMYVSQIEEPVDLVILETNQGRLCTRVPKERISLELKATCSTVLLHGLMEQGHRPGRDVVASQQHGPGPGLPVELLRQRRVAREGAVRRSAEALRPQHPRQAPRPPPRPLQRAHGAPRQRRAQQHQLPRERRRLQLRVTDDGGAEQRRRRLAAGPHGRDRLLAGRGARWPVERGAGKLASEEPTVFFGGAGPQEPCV